MSAESGFVQAANDRFQLSKHMLFADAIAMSDAPRLLRARSGHRISRKERPPRGGLSKFDQAVSVTQREKLIARFAPQ
jgi:hypothetical protein